MLVDDGEPNAELLFELGQLTAILQQFLLK